MSIDTKTARTGMIHRQDSSKDRIFAGIFNILVINHQLI